MSNWEAFLNALSQIDGDERALKVFEVCVLVDEENEMLKEQNEKLKDLIGDAFDIFKEEVNKGSMLPTSDLVGWVRKAVNLVCC